MINNYTISIPSRKSRANSTVFFLLGIFAGLNVIAQQNTALQDTGPGGRQESNFDQGWRFHRGGAQGAQETFFDDTGWRRVDLPHDWSIEDLPGTESPFSRDAISQVSGGFTVGGTGWYRKSFELPAFQKGQHIIIQFDGAYMNTEVWLNGSRVGEHPYGYTPFWFDLTDKVSFTTNNILVVKVSNEGENSRWYSGSGIYRHVWLKLVNPVHVAPDGVYVTTTQVSPSTARIKIQTGLTNQDRRFAQIRLLTRIVGVHGKEIGRMETSRRMDAGDSSKIDQGITIQSPALWSLDQPILYTNLTEVYRNDELADRVATPFGIRQISFDVTNGFCLNGRPIKLKGGCLHHDNGPLGAKSYDRAEERKVEIMKAAGFNAVRCAHNPPSKAFLEACDRLGMLVLDEAFDMWEEGKNPNDYHLYFRDRWQKDLENMIERDRNHPSVILWSIGNEIPDKEKSSVVATAKQLSDNVHRLDPTRPVTSAVNDIKEDKDAYFDTLDIAGYNYPASGDTSQYELDHQRKPSRIMVCTESFPLDSFGSWIRALDHPYVIGDFVWTGWDYLGEASIGWRGYEQSQDFYPWNLAYCGDVDICGWRRPQSFYRETLWQKDKLSIFIQSPHPSFDENPRRKDWSRWHFDDLLSDWNWDTNAVKSLSVTVFSSCEQVELFLNGQSLGRKPTSRATQFKAVWPAIYQPGSLEAVGYDAGQKIASAELSTATAAVRILLTADHSKLVPSGEDLSYVTVELLDSKGVLNPKADNLVHFEMDGPGAIIGVGNANPVSLESCQRPERKCWRGRCLVVVKSGSHPGTITLKATSKNMIPAQVALVVSE
jgi:beta-galactosidase